MDFKRAVAADPALTASISNRAVNNYIKILKEHESQSVKKMEADSGDGLSRDFSGKENVEKGMRQLFGEDRRKQSESESPEEEENLL